ncbi:MAG: hypothetical protein ACE37B_09980 [Ilumatobacter sp.]|uniref:hypothetical protein n=1 Tax=Ilumatobacter sp. TaxID=1967498 RepID=UPI003918EB6D
MQLASPPSLFSGWVDDMYILDDGSTYVSYDQSSVGVGGDVRIEGILSADSGWEETGVENLPTNEFYDLSDNSASIRRAADAQNSSGSLVSVEFFEKNGVVQDVKVVTRTVDLITGTSTSSVDDLPTFDPGSVGTPSDPGFAGVSELEVSENGAVAVSLLTSLSDGTYSSRLAIKRDGSWQEIDAPAESIRDGQVFGGWDRRDDRDQLEFVDSDVVMVKGYQHPSEDPSCLASLSCFALLYRIDGENETSWSSMNTSSGQLAGPIEFLEVIDDSLNYGIEIRGYTSEGALDAAEILFV